MRLGFQLKVPNPPLLSVLVVESDIALLVPSLFALVFITKVVGPRHE